MGVKILWSAWPVTPSPAHLCTQEKAQQWSEHIYENPPGRKMLMANGVAETKLAIKLYLGETEMIRQWTNSLQSFEVDRPQRLQLPIMQIPRGSELFAHEHGHEIAPGSGVLSRAKAVTAAWNALPIFEKVDFSTWHRSELIGHFSLHIHYPILTT